MTDSGIEGGGVPRGTRALFWIASLTGLWLLFNLVAMPLAGGEWGLFYGLMNLQLSFALVMLFRTKSKIY